MRGVQDFYVVFPRKRRHPEPTEAVRQWLLNTGSEPPQRSSHSSQNRHC
jgi:LysR family glycine cleavage system transcriptional activator